MQHKSKIRSVHTRGGQPLSHRNRRHFVGSLAGAAVGGLGWRVPARAAANERTAVAVVGLGGRGTQVLRDFLQQPDVQVIAVCDVHPTHYRDKPWGKGPRLGSEPARELVQTHYAAAAKSGNYRGCHIVTDYRSLFERGDLDAVVVATPDHWHAQITLDALDKGLDVYCEKPITHCFAEGQAVYRAANKRQAVFQVGSQQRSDILFQRAVEVVRNGHLGKITRIEVGLPEGYRVANAETTPRETPPGLDYDKWVGPAEKLPYAPAWHHRWWRSVRAFGGGVLMDWIGHHNDIAHWGIDESLGGPQRVEVARWTASECPEYDTPAEYAIQMEYRDGIQSFISTQVEQGTKWIGDAGWLWVNRGKIKASNATWLTAEFDPGPWRIEPSPGHVANFVECVRTRATCITNAEIGHRSITPGHLAYVSHELKRPIGWNAAQEVIVDDAEAQQRLLQVDYREPWDFSAS